MGIKITQQTNTSECACCVITSLHNFFYNKKVDKSDVLQTAKINDSGISLYDFELLANKYNMSCESFQCEWNEFKSLKINSYIVCLIKQNDIYHYTIVKKNDKNLVMYDSIKGKVIINYLDFQKIYCEVIVFVSKSASKNNLEIENKISFMTFLDIKYQIIYFSVTFIAIAASMISASFLNYVIELAINNESVSNLITVVFVFGIIILLENLLDYILSLYSKKNFKNLHNLFLNNLLSKLNHKEFDFKYKVNLNWLCKCDEMINVIAMYFSLNINQLLSSVMLFSIASVLILIINYWIGLLIIISLAINGVFFVIKLKKQIEILKSISNFDNSNNNNINELINYYRRQINAFEKKFIFDKIKKNYGELNLVFNDTINYSSLFILFEKMVENFIYVFLIGMIGFLIITENSITIGELTFVISLFGLNKNSTKDFFDFFLNKYKFGYFSKIYLDLIKIGNVDFCAKEINNKISKITLINNETGESTNVLNRDCMTKNNILNIICNKENKVLINDSKSDLTSFTNLYEKIILVDSFSKFSHFNISRSDFVDEVLSKWSIAHEGIDIKFYEQLINNLIYLSQITDHIILYENIDTMLNEKDKQIFETLIKPKIEENNFVIYLKDSNG